LDLADTKGSSTVMPADPFLSFAACETSAHAALVPMQQMAMRSIGAFI